MTSKLEDICSKFPFKKIKKCEGVINYKIIAKYKQTCQPSSQHWDGESTVIGKYFQRPVHSPQAGSVPINVDTAEIPRYIHIHIAQVDQWRQMVPNGKCGRYPEAATFRITV